MNQKDLEIIAFAYAKDFFKIPVPSITFAPISVLGRNTDGMYFSGTNTIWVRRKPTIRPLRFLIAHELAHAWQYFHKKPFNEMEADAMAYDCCGPIDSHFPDPPNRFT